MAEQSSISVIDNVPVRTIQMPSLPTISEIESITAICRIAAQSNFVNSSAPMNNQNQRMADAFFVVMMGRELGIPAMMALKTIFVIEGKPSCSGQALLSLMRRAGVEVVVPDPATITDRATVKVKRPGGEWHEYTYTEEMAKQAGLLGRNIWGKYKREMMLWRAVSTANRFETPDITGGMYTIEEIAPPNLEVNAEGDVVGQLSLAASNPSPAPDNIIIDEARPWLNPKDVAELVGYAQSKLHVTAADICRYLSIDDVLNLSNDKGWGKYKTSQEATTKIKEGFDADQAKLAANDKPAQPKSATTKWTMAALKNNVLKDVYGGNTFHMDASIKKLVEQGKLPPALTLEQAIEVVKSRKEEAEHKDESQELFDNLPSVKDVPPVPEGDVPF